MCVYICKSNKDHKSNLYLARNTLSRNIGYTQTFFILFEQEWSYKNFKSLIM